MKLNFVVVFVFVCCKTDSLPLLDTTGLKLSDHKVCELKTEICFYSNPRTHSIRNKIFIELEFHFLIIHSINNKSYFPSCVLSCS